MENKQEIIEWINYFAKAFSVKSINNNIKNKTGNNFINRESNYNLNNILDKRKTKNKNVKNYQKTKLEIKKPEELNNMSSKNKKLSVPSKKIENQINSNQRILNTDDNNNNQEIFDKKNIVFNKKNIKKSKKISPSNKDNQDNNFDKEKINQINNITQDNDVLKKQNNKKKNPLNHNKFDEEEILPNRNINMIYERKNIPTNNISLRNKKLNGEQQNSNKKSNKELITFKKNETAKNEIQNEKINENYNENIIKKKEKNKKHNNSSLNTKKVKYKSVDMNNSENNNNILITDINSFTFKKNIFDHYNRNYNPEFNYKIRNKPLLTDYNSRKIPFNKIKSYKRIKINGLEYPLGPFDERVKEANFIRHKKNIFVDLSNFKEETDLSIEKWLENYYNRNPDKYHFQDEISNYRNLFFPNDYSYLNYHNYRNKTPTIKSKIQISNNNLLENEDINNLTDRVYTISNKNIDNQLNDNENNSNNIIKRLCFGDNFTFGKRNNKNENTEENLNKKKSNSCQNIKENNKILNLIKNPNLIYGAGNEFTINVNKGKNENYDILEIDN